VFEIKPHPDPAISVVIPSRDGHAGGNVARLLEALGRQRRIGEAEILLVVGERPNGHARNVGVAAARGRWLVFTDDDAGLQGEGNLEALLEPLERSEAGDGPRWGMTGTATALPAEATPFQRRVAAALPRALYGEVDRVTETDMAHHLCCALPRRVYDEIGGESDTLETGTDVDLRQRLRAAGYGIAVVPGPPATHPQPGSLGALWRKHLWYGCGLVQLHRQHGATGRHVIRGGRPAVAIHLARALATFPLRTVRFDRASPWRWNPLLAVTDLAQKVGYGRAYWRHLAGRGPWPEGRWLSSRSLARRLAGDRPGRAAPPPQQVGRLLVVLSAGMGDAITFLPTLAALRRHYRRARLTVWTARRGAAEVVRRQGAADAVWCRDLDGRGRPARLARKLAMAARLRAGRFDLAVVNFINSNDETALLLRLGGVPVRLGYVDDPSRPGLYNLPVLRVAPDRGPVAALRHGDLLQALGIPPAPAPRWPVPEAARRRAAALAPAGSRPVIGLHPGSGALMAWKRWPAERFAALADRLAAGGADIWLFGGADESELTARVAAAMAAPARDWTGEPDLDVTAALMERCDLFVSNDSGLYNLALALPVPVLALFGPTLPVLSGPWPRPEPARILTRSLPCHPCLDPLMPPRDLLCPIGRRCLLDVTVDRAADACREMLAAAAAGRPLPEGAAALEDRP
jgi:ADP-heptose:LPS heptosyltransferase